MHDSVKKTFKDESDMFFAERMKWKTEFTKAQEKMEARIQSIIGDVEDTREVVKDVDIFMKHVLEIQMISQLV